MPNRDGLETGRLNVTRSACPNVRTQTKTEKGSGRAGLRRQCGGVGRVAPAVRHQEHHRHHAQEQDGQHEKGLRQALDLMTGMSGDGRDQGNPDDGAPLASRASQSGDRPDVVGGQLDRGVIRSRRGQPGPEPGYARPRSSARRRARGAPGGWQSWPGPPRSGQCRRLWAPDTRCGE